MKKTTVIGISVTSLWVLILATIILINLDKAEKMPLNEWGDLLGGFMAPLALFWVVLGYIQQGEELRLNTEALKAQQEELRMQTEETAALAASANRQALAAEALAREARRERMQKRFDAIVRNKNPTSRSEGDTNSPP